MATTWSSAVTGTLYSYNQSNSNHSDDVYVSGGVHDAAQIASLHARYVTLSVTGIVANVLLAVLILLSNTLRTKPLFWNILNLCVFDSVIVMFVIPIGMDYELDWTWKHGKWMCKVWYVTDILHMFLSGITLACICADRIVATVKTVKPLSANLLRYLAVGFVACPWILLLLVCIPVMVAVEKGEDQQSFSFSYCYYNFHESSLTAVVVFTLILPNILVFTMVSAMLFTYIIRGGRWGQIPSTHTEMDENGLRMSIISVWVLGTVCVVCWLPLSIYVLFVLKFQEKCLSKNFSWDDYTVVYIVQLMTSSITPWFWVILQEVRHELAIWRRIVFGILKFGSPDVDNLVTSYGPQSRDYDLENIQDNTN